MYRRQRSRDGSPSLKVGACHEPVDRARLSVFLARPGRIDASDWSVMIALTTILLTVSCFLLAVSCVVLVLSYRTISRHLGSTQKPADPSPLPQPQGTKSPDPAFGDPSLDGGLPPYSGGYGGLPPYSGGYGDPTLPQETEDNTADNEFVVHSVTPYEGSYTSRWNADGTAGGAFQEAANFPADDLPVFAIFRLGSNPTAICKLTGKQAKDCACDRHRMRGQPV
jgi:hypothetical protein